MSLITEYSNNWKDLGSIYVYQSPTFQFKPCVLITEFEGCLIKRLNPNSLYHSISPKNIEQYDEEYMKQLKTDTNYSIVIISHNFGTGKLVVDSLKLKVELCYEQFKLPMLCLFATQKNRLSKPHTGMWVFLKAYFKKIGNITIEKTCVVSDFGGRTSERTTAKGKTIIKADKTDTDRAFAHNIKVPFHTVMEFISDDAKEKFNWNNNILSPELREVYVKKLLGYKNPNIFTELFADTTVNQYMIIIYGAPRSGKTTLARELLQKWRKSNYGKSHAIKRLGSETYTKSRRINMAKKILLSRISIIIDGNTHTDDLRKPFEDMAARTKTRVMYIEVNPGLGMSSIFNHVAVETAQDENITLVGTHDYHHYKSIVTRPKNVLLYCPVVKKTEPVMSYRW